jgi:hypothetical protein
MMRRRLGKEASILLLSALPVLVQDAFKSGEDEPGVVQIFGWTFLVYGLILVVRLLFWVARARD